MHRKWMELKSRYSSDLAKSGYKATTKMKRSNESGTEGDVQRDNDVSNMTRSENLGSSARVLRKGCL